MTDNVISLQPALDKKQEAERLEAVENAEIEAATKEFQQHLFEAMGLNFYVDLSDKAETTD